MPQRQLSTSPPPPSSSSPVPTSLTPPSATTTTRTRSRSLSNSSAPTARGSPGDSILHGRLHSSQQVCQHRSTGQLSEHPPAVSVLVPLTRPPTQPLELCHEKIGNGKTTQHTKQTTLTTNKLLTLKYFCSTTNNTKTENNPPEEYPFPRFEHLNRNNHLPIQKAEKRSVEVDRLRTNDRTRKKRRKKDEEMSHTKHVRKQTKICNLTTN